MYGLCLFFYIETKSKLNVFICFHLFYLENKMAASPIVLSSRQGERAYLTTLNERFGQYVNRVRSMREQSKNIENNTFIAHTQALENEIFDLKNIYERELDNTRQQLDAITAERNEFHLQASKNGALATELQEK